MSLFTFSSKRPPFRKCDGELTYYVVLSIIVLVGLPLLVGSVGAFFQRDPEVKSHLLIGSSHLYHGVAPNILSSHTRLLAVRSVNYGHLNLLARRNYSPSLRFLWIELSGNLHFVGFMENLLLQKKLDLLWELKLRPWDLVQHRSLRTYWNWGKWLFTGGVAEAQRWVTQRLGSQPMGAQFRVAKVLNGRGVYWNGKAAQRLRRFSAEKKAGFKSQRESLLQLVKFYRLRGVKVSFLIPPHYQSFWEHVDSGTLAIQKQTVQWVEDQLGEKIPIYDFGTFLASQSEFYFDETHLNGRGAEQFTLALNALTDREPKRVVLPARDDASLANLESRRTPPLID